jgi:hypothetical protein
MLQESTTWDLWHMTRGPSSSTKIHMLFLLVVCIVTTVKLIRVWRTALPFRFSPGAGNPEYLRLLQTSGTSLKQWICLTGLMWGVFASVSLYDFCNGLLIEKQTPREMLLFAIQDFSTTLTMTLLVALFSFLARWHMLKRIEYLRHMPD